MGVIACPADIPRHLAVFQARQVPEQKTVIQREVVRADSQADLSVVHYNVKENNRYMDRLAEDVLAAGADVVSLQELRPETFPVADTILECRLSPTSGSPWSTRALQWPSTAGIPLLMTVFW